MIRPVQSTDASSICAIYNHYIENSTVTFEEAGVTESGMMQRIEETLQSLPWLVYEEDGVVLGYACASKWKGRCAYRYSVESSVYLDLSHCGKGIGQLLYTELINQLVQKGFHSAIAGIALPNDASIRLHEKMGFQKVAHFNEVGRKFEKWIDVGYWQLQLNHSLNEIGSGCK